MSHDQHLWSALPLPAFVFDQQGCLIRANGAAESFLNLSERQLLREGLAAHLLFSADLDDAISRVVSTQGVVFIEKSNLNVAGRSWHKVNLHLSPLSVEQHTDQSDRMKNQVLLLLQPQNGAEHIGQMKDAKSAARQAIGMAEMLAHEIKNPLAGITGAAQLLSMSLAPKDQELTDLIVSESRRIVALLDQVETFGDLRPPVQTPCNVHGILDRARATAQIGFAPDMAFELDYDPSLPEVFVDQDQIQQVILNLLKNAAEASDGKGKITLRTYYDAGVRVRKSQGMQSSLALQIEVIDNGPGIDPEIIEDVFDPFISGRENGTGLGLALVSKILSDHGALISLDSRQGRTCFRISLPVTPPKILPASGLSSSSDATD